jgi:hypothetical protein
LKKAIVWQAYVKKKFEVLVAPTPKAPPPTIIIGSMEAPITNHVGPIVIEDSLAPKQNEAPKDVARVEKEKNAEKNSKYMQPKWFPRGLNKTQRCKL